MIASKIDLAKLNQQASISLYSTPSANKDASINLINNALQDVDEFESGSAGSNFPGGSKTNSLGVHFELRKHFFSC
jgi:hypothetical protein